MACSWFVEHRTQCQVLRMPVIDTEGHFAMTHLVVRGWLRVNVRTRDGNLDADALDAVVEQ